MSMLTHMPSLKATPMFFKENTFNRDYLPDSYHHFGLGIHPHYPRSFSLPPRNDAPPMFNDHGFQVSLDVHGFLPSEISVKVLDTVRTIAVEAKVRFLFNLKKKGYESYFI